MASKPTETCSPVEAMAQIPWAGCVRRQFLRQAEQAIRLAAHCRRNNDDLVPGACPLGNAFGNVSDALGRAHRRAAVLVDEKCHESV
jgi:hypothetical protein